MGERDDPEHGVTATIESARRRLRSDDADPVMRQVRNVGITTWTVIGVAFVATGVVGVMAAISELVLPLALAVIIGASAYPAARRLQERGLKPALAAGAVLAAAVLLVVGLVWVVVATVVDQVDAVSAQADAAMEEVAGPAADAGVDDEALDQGRDALGSLSPAIAEGLVTALVGGLGALVGFVGGSVLALLILYYVLKDGPSLRDTVISILPEAYRSEAEDFTATAVRALRSYWAGRSVLSAAVTAVVVVACLLMGLPLIATIAVVNFVGGFVPYIGAFIGGGLATIIALGDKGFGPALVLLAVILFANLVLENVLEPRIMGGRLEIHPLLVLIATTLGGVVGGIVGLIVAVPLTVIGLDLAKRIGRLAREARLG